MSGYSSVGFPSIVVPMGFGSQGLPMTITFFGKPYEEMKIIGFAYAYEQASKMRKPPALVRSRAKRSTTPRNDDQAQTAWPRG